MLRCHHSMGLTPAVSGRRPDAAFHVQSKPQAGGGHEHGIVSLRLVLLFGSVLSFPMISLEKHERVFKRQPQQQAATGFILHWCRYYVLGHRMDVPHLPLQGALAIVGAGTSCRIG